MVLVDKALLDELLTTVKSMQETIDNIQDYVHSGVAMIGSLAEKFGVA